MAPPNQAVSLVDCEIQNGDGVVSEQSDPRDIISQRNQRESPLLRLPAELRNKIYEYVVGGHRIRPYWETAMLGPDTSYDGWGYPKSHLSLLGACRQTFSEIGLLPFTLNTFGGYPENFLDTMASLPTEQAGAIQTMFLYVDAFGTYRDGVIDYGIAKWFITMLEELCSYPGLRRLDLVWYDPEREGLCERLRQVVLEGVNEFHKRGIELTVRYWGEDLL